jgi:hypothetical protein
MTQVQGRGRFSLALRNQGGRARKSRVIFVNTYLAFPFPCGQPRDAADMREKLGLVIIWKVWTRRILGAFGM